MADGFIDSFRDAIIMDYRAPADTVRTNIHAIFFASSTHSDDIKFQITDVTGKGSRRVVAFTLNAREIN